MLFILDAAVALTAVNEWLPALDTKLRTRFAWYDKLISEKVRLDFVYAKQDKFYEVDEPTKQNDLLDSFKKRYIQLVKFVFSAIGFCLGFALPILAQGLCVAIVRQILKKVPGTFVFGVAGVLVGVAITKAKR